MVLIWMDERTSEMRLNQHVYFEEKKEVVIVMISEILKDKKSMFYSIKRL